ncbi:MAG: lipid-A-disaccharide synthase, partial [Candidatus Omnitrophica bacterium]|nr:lipid-A-disaccharide synthase [Candidatus Omnitrophota bacterium]
MINKIMILAGEPSGDLHASRLAVEIKKLSPQIKLFGMGGENMRHAGVDTIYDLKALAITGLLDVIKNYSRLKEIQNTLVQKALDEKPDLVVLVDYADFNLRFAKRLKKTGIPVIYYIPPQVWAWRKGRIKQIRRYIKKVYVIFKFEEALYREAEIPVEFIGHPLLDIVKLPVASCQLPVKSPIIALLPGSRKRLVKTLLPIMIETAKLIREKLPTVKFIISKPLSLDKKIYEKFLKNCPLPVTLMENKTYEIISAADLVLTVSGTSTLETAILGKPMVIIYKLPLFEYMLARPMLLIRNLGLVLQPPPLHRH